MTRAVNAAGAGIRIRILSAQAEFALRPGSAKPAVIVRMTDAPGSRVREQWAELERATSADGRPFSAARARIVRPAMGDPDLSSVRMLARAGRWDEGAAALEAL